MVVIAKRRGLWWGTWVMMMKEPEWWAAPAEAEWIEPDGLGGYSMGTVSGEGTRRYHSFLSVATHPPTGRVCLVQGISLIRVHGERLFPGAGLSVQARFCREPWPSWSWDLPQGRLLMEFCVPKDGVHPRSLFRFKAEGWKGAAPRIALDLLLTGRDYHGPCLEEVPDWTAQVLGGGAVFERRDARMPKVLMRSDGRITGGFHGSRPVVYREETRRGLDDWEVGLWVREVEFDLDRTRYCVLTVPGPVEVPNGEEELRDWCEAEFGREERRRKGLGGWLERSADQFLIKRGEGLSILAGFPWFTDWGRDTFIAMRGLLWARGRWNEGAAILLEWARTVDRGMVPNFFPDEQDTPEYNSVDASLWYCVCIGEALEAVHRGDLVLSGSQEQVLRSAVSAILRGYQTGTRFGIAQDDEDGLLRAGQEGWQLTWMDARSDGREVTPRMGKPVEIQALWYNALMVGGNWDEAWRVEAHRVAGAFRERFLRPDGLGLYDVVDTDHRRGSYDKKIRPNQIFAVGGLPYSLLDGQEAKGVVAIVEERLWTPLGLRSLSPEDEEYCPRYEGNRIERDAQYHQGTVWGWLAGPFLEAWLRVHPGREGAERVRDHYLAGLDEHLRGVGLGHITEVANGDVPHERGGCPAQAWSLGEYLRVRERVMQILGEFSR